MVSLSCGPAYREKGNHKGICLHYITRRGAPSELINFPDCITCILKAHRNLECNDFVPNGTPMCVLGLRCKAPLPGEGVWKIHKVAGQPSLQIPWKRRGRGQGIYQIPCAGRGGGYQIDCQSLNTHRSKHGSGGAQQILRDDTL